MSISEFVFWLTIGIVIYTYIGYPIIIFVLSLFVNNVNKKHDIEPKVTFLITAYNEEASIAKKLDNTLKLDYPKEKLEIIVASDGSTDKTDEIVKQYSKYGVKLIRVEGRVGKTETQNVAVKQAKGEIVIFSDATTEYRHDAIKKIIRNYADPSVGGVSGGFDYVPSRKTSVAFGNILYWKFEKKLKEWESKIKTLLGASGCMYSVRKKLYEPLPPDIISDFIEPLKIVEKGYRVIFEPEAVGYELTMDKPKKELNMRIRVFSRGMRGVLYMKHLLNPLKYPFISFQLFSHKILRWLIPVFAIILFISNTLLLNSAFYTKIFYAQIFFYLIALIGLFCEKILQKHIKLLSLPVYFLIVNIALFISLFKLITGKKYTVWETSR